MVERLIPVAGLCVFLAIAYMFSENRKAVSWRIVLWGLGLQWVFAILVLKTKLGATFFAAARDVVNRLIEFSVEGSSFLFGTLATDHTIGALFAFRVLPVIIFISSLMAVLWYFRVIQCVVRGMAFVMRKTMRISGVEAFSAALLVFMGIESMSAVREYLAKMNRSSLFLIMTAFMATIAGSVMVLYASFGISPGHLLAASVMSAPAAVVVAKLFVPAEQDTDEREREEIYLPVEYSNALEAASEGAVCGVSLALNVGAVIIAFIALIAGVNFLLRFGNLSLEQIFGFVCAPCAFLMGIPLRECVEAGQFIGTKTVMNEAIAFLALSESTGVSERTRAILTYALCGFANFGSLGILMVVLRTLVPERLKEVSALGIKSLIAGTLAAFMTAAIAGVLL